jgi:tetratricopeptide (TPR) repeat protein
MTTLNSSTIRKWSEAGLFRQVDLGLSTHDANLEAERCWVEFLGGTSVSQILADVENLPDILHALSRLLQDSTDTASGKILGAAVGLFEFVSDDLRLVAGTDEKHYFSSTFAYVAWRSCRRMGLWREARIWESRCEAHVKLQDDVAEYLRLGAKDRARASARFLRDRATLLVACRQLRQQFNQDPDGSFLFALAAYRFVSSGWEVEDTEERAFFAGELALAAGSTLRLAGRYSESGSWFQAAAECFSRTEHSAPLMARIELNVAAALYNRQEMDADSLSRLPRLCRLFTAFGLKGEANRCKLLEGMFLKDLGRTEDAIATLSSLAREESVLEEPLIHGLALAQLGEAQASVGSREDSLKSFAAAIPLLEEANAPWAIADCNAMLAQALRDQGRVEEAIPLYRKAVDLNLAMRLDGRAAYFRILYAEALLMGGRESAATDEILAALPVLKREELVPASTAAFALLQESLRRQAADPEAVRRLRVELQRMREGPRP